MTAKQLRQWLEALPAKAQDAEVYLCKDFLDTDDYGNLRDIYKLKYADKMTTVADDGLDFSEGTMIVLEFESERG